MLEISASQPIFIVGMNGSGTTMLLDCMNNHPDIYGFMRETKIIPYYLKKIGKYGDLKQDKNFLTLFNEFRNLSIFRYTNDGVAPPIPKNWKSLPRNLASVVDSVFSYYAVKAGKKYWCEKTPMHAQHIFDLSKLFPHAKFIHIIRDGRACSASFYRRFNYTPKLTMYRWKNVVREARRQGNLVGERYMEIRYEDLTASPESHMRNICDFTHVKYNDKLLMVSRKRTSTGSSALKIEPNLTLWDKILSNRTLKDLELIGGKLLNELNYKTNYPKSDLNPDKLLIKYWLYRDYFLRGLHELKKPKKNKWDDLSAIIIRSIMQRIASKY